MESQLGRIIHPLLAGLMLLEVIVPMLCLVDISFCETKWLATFYTWSGYYSDHYLIGAYFIWYSFYLAICFGREYPACLGSALYSLGFILLTAIGLSRALWVRQWLTRLHRALIGVTLALVPVTAYCWQGGLLGGFWLGVGLVTMAGLTEIILRLISRLRATQ